MPKSHRNSPATALTAAALRAWPLPQPGSGGDKDSRGQVLIVGGAVEMPGAIVLAATAALRSGAGKLQIATCRSIAPLVGIAVPEARVFALPETPDGAIDPAAAEQIVARANKSKSVLLGPGMINEAAVAALLARALPALSTPTVILDAAALTGDAALLRPLAGRVILTPHLGEMATLLGRDKTKIEADVSGTAAAAAAQLGAVVALKGAETWIAAPDGQRWHYSNGSVGLATSGSGDTLAGIVAGLAARGAEPAQAAAWGVVLHGEAGNRLAQRLGRLGFLARELLDEIPPIMQALG